MKFNAKKAHIAPPKTAEILLSDSQVSRRPGESVEDIEAIKEDVDKMVAALAAGGFAGKYKQAYAIAHQQIKNPHFRFFVVNPAVRQLFSDHVLIISPEIVSFEGKPVLKHEHCLTHPLKNAKAVERHETVFATWIDRELKIVNVRLTGIAAQVFQHELDHCNGRTVWLAPEEEEETA